MSGGIPMTFFKIRTPDNAFFLFLLIASFFLGCAPQPGVSENVLDSPGHHTSNGFKLIKKGYLYDATREFNLALELAPNYSPAYRGLGLIYGMEKNFKQAFSAMDNAKTYAKEKEDKALAYVGFMRLYTIRLGKDWLGNVEDSFLEATGSLKNLPEAYYYMGVAYEKAGKASQSKKAFETVLRINKGLVSEASEALERIKK